MYDSLTLDLVVGEHVSVDCLAEWHLMSLERRFWEDAATVDEYLGKFVPEREIYNVQNPNKLREYLLSKQ